MQVQKTHLAIHKHHDGTVTTQCGKRLKGHTGYRFNIRLVSCQDCLIGAGVGRPAPKYGPADPVGAHEVGYPRTWEGWMEYIREHNLQELGHGASRKAFALTEGRVIKVEHHMDGWGQCASEVKRWQQAGPDLKPYLAEIFDHGKGWIVMERAKDTLKAFDHNTKQTIRQDLREGTQIGDLHDGNIGYFGMGRFKILDYAL